MLVGCARLREIPGCFDGRDADGVDMCPRSLSAGLNGAVLTKCCLFEDRVERDADATIVPWRARGVHLFVRHESGIVASDVTGLSQP